MEAGRESQESIREEPLLEEKKADEEKEVKGNEIGKDVHVEDDCSAMKVM